MANIKHKDNTDGLGYAICIVLFFIIALSVIAGTLMAILIA